jgi:antitoxin ParD1/3/4
MIVAITLTPEQEAWVATRVAKGEFASPEAAVRRLIDASMADYASIVQDDLAWAKPYVEEAIAQVDRGEVVALEEYDAHMDALFGRLNEP